MESSNSEYSADPQLETPTAEGRSNFQVGPPAPALNELYEDIRECCPTQSTPDLDSSKHAMDYGGNLLRNISITSSNSGELSFSSVSSLGAARMSSLEEGGKDDERLKQLEEKVDTMECKQEKYEKELKEKTALLEEKDKQMALIQKELELAKKEIAQEKREKEWFKKLSEDRLKQIEDLEKEKDRLSLEVKELRSEMKRVKQDLDNMRNQNTGIQSSVDKMQRKFEQVLPDNGKKGSLKEMCLASVAETFSRASLQDKATCTSAVRNEMTGKNFDTTKRGSSENVNHSVAGSEEHSNCDSASIADVNNQ